MTEKRQAKRRRAYKTSSILAIALIIVLAAFFALNQPAFVPMQCFDNNTNFSSSFTAKLFIEVGNNTNNFAEQYVRIPPNVGVFPGCIWPVGTRGNTTSERGTNWTLIHIESPKAYPYTLADFFHVWGITLWGDTGKSVYLASDGVGAVRGPTYMSVNFAPEVPVNPGYVFHYGDFVVIHVHSPYTTVST